MVSLGGRLRTCHTGTSRRPGLATAGLFPRFATSFCLSLLASLFSRTNDVAVAAAERAAPNAGAGRGAADHGPRIAIACRKAPPVENFTWLPVGINSNKPAVARSRCFKPDSEWCFFCSRGPPCLGNEAQTSAAKPTTDHGTGFEIFFAGYGHVSTSQQRITRHDQSRVACVGWRLCVQPTAIAPYHPIRVARLGSWLGVQA